MICNRDTKAERIARARAALADAYAANPEAVSRYEARQAKLAAAAKRERERFEHLVLGRPRPLEIVTVGTRGGKRKKPRRATRPAQVDPSIAAAVEMREAWSHKVNATPETMEHASRTHDGALAQLHANGTITADQLEWAAQIANVHRSIEADVAVKVASLEARVDSSSRPQLVAERIHRVRMHLAYGIWRVMLPAPKALVLDMIVGDAIGYSVAAKRHRVHNRRAKRLLIEAIDRWPLCVAHAFSAVDQPMVDAMNAAVAPLGVATIGRPIVVRPESYDTARAVEAGREQTDEPYLLPAIDPAFLDDRGILRPWGEIAAIIRERMAERMETEA